MKILVTGGAGYIGSVLVNKLIEQGHQVNVIDDLSNGFRENIDRRAKFTEGSILDKGNLNQALEGVEVVYHLAAKIRVEEGEAKPELYKKVNIEGTLDLIKACVDKKIAKFIFASTAAVYGDPEEFPVNENSKTNPVNVYGATKLEIDKYLEANAKNMGISTICFRFFNIGGALKTKEGSWLKIKHEGATHLIPSILHSSSNKPLLIFGNDWPTKDGTPTRDFVHVVDLADALIKALNSLDKAGNQIINLGTATGSTVLEVVKTAEKSLNKVISYNFAGRRAGDSFALVTSNQKAKEILNWQPTKTLSDILIDAQDELLANN
jgi:UDP-glucose 4-epimerase